MIRLLPLGALLTLAASATADEGDFDNRARLATRREIGYRGPVGLMCYGIPGDARPHLARSMAAWRSLNPRVRP